MNDHRIIRELIAEVRALRQSAREWREAYEATASRERFYVGFLRLRATEQQHTEQELNRLKGYL